LAREIADRVLVMYAGEVVESGPIDAVFDAPMMPYTAALLRSRPRLGEGRAQGELMQPIRGGVPDLANPPAGCGFHPRCAHARPGLCDASAPVLDEADPDRHVRCLRWRELSL